MIAGGYGLLATLWIYFSDEALRSFVGDTEMLVTWSMHKGLAFVAVTTLLLLIMVRRAFGAMVKGYEALQESEERNRLTLENILEGCQILDRNWRYLYLNQSAAVHNRRPAEEMLGKRMQDMWPGVEQTPVYRMMARCMEHGVTVQDEVEFAFADGTHSWFHVRVSPVPEGIFVVSVDITEQKEAGRKLIALNEELERKVQERTAQLQEAMHRAESADRLKSAFLATMSHELRTPLNSIIGFTGIMLQQLAGPLNPEQMKQLGMVQGSSRHLLELINDVLDLSKIEAGQLEVRAEEFDLVEVTARVAASMKPLADKKDLTLEFNTVHPSLVIAGDRRRTEQVLINLINNALKFTERGGVKVKLDSSGPSAVVAVVDTGMGIAAEDLKSLFKPFRQIDTGLARQHEGTGLGLAICHRLLKLMKGSISVQSQPGAGSEFTIRLPLTSGAPLIQPTDAV